MKRRYMKFLIWLILGISLSIIGFFTGGLLVFWHQIDTTSKSNVIGHILSGTLSLGALSLAVLAYSFSEIHSRPTTTQKAPYRRLAFIAFMIIPLSLANAVISCVFILTKIPYSFEASLILLYAIVVGLTFLVGHWIMEEL